MASTRSDRRQKDLYRVLGVTAAATSQDITAAYRRLVHRLHPDAHPNDSAAHEQFLEATLAYEVLGRPETRRDYDQARGKAAATKTGTPTSEPPASPSGPRPAARQASGNRPAFVKKGADLALTVPVGFADLVLGVELNVPSPAGGTVGVRIPPGTPNGRTFRVRGLGSGGPGRGGDLLVTCEVVVPTELTPAQRRAVQALSRADDAVRKRGSDGQAPAQGSATAPEGQAPPRRRFRRSRQPA